MPLTEMQENFAVAYAMNGGHAREAAIEAGYSPENARSLGPRQMRNPEVVDRVLEELHKMRARSGAVGLDVLIEVAQSKSATAAARVSAARTLVEHAGLVGLSRDAEEENARARSSRSNGVVDYLAVLDALQNLRPANDSGATLGQEFPIEVREALG